ncbi:hypothetical protein [Jeotgalibacillus campisalis]|uniref:Uncharacterized protein n=1 Tax=Jeotgalibacillus campisalis TaxID=220754 RepID=A0A0C2VWD8_9BACL|nr:hypothetical protein [Jeotgalibacillus campisalis]KIL53197.1 hypothetical protein KR50_05260 [Jeotgalibacillus campisalis]
MKNMSIGAVDKEKRVENISTVVHRQHIEWGNVSFCIEALL